LYWLYHHQVIEPCLPCYKLGISDDYRFGAALERVFLKPKRVHKAM
jgi:hypothetical protein